MSVARNIPDFDDADRWVVEFELKKHLGRAVHVEFADAEIQLDPASREFTECPVFYWQDRGVEFVILKTDAGRFRGQFHSAAAEHYGVEQDFNDLAECVSITLKLHANHELERGSDLAHDDSEAAQGMMPGAHHHS